MEIAMVGGIGEDPREEKLLPPIRLDSLFYPGALYHVLLRGNAGEAEHSPEEI